METTTIAKRLLSLRGEKKQEEVAAVLGLSMDSIIDYEQGTRIPNDAMKLKIAAYYNVSVDWLFYE